MENFLFQFFTTKIGFRSSILNILYSILITPFMEIEGFMKLSIDGLLQIHDEVSDDQGYIPVAFDI
ncbi:MAG: hypothetical protein QGF57_01240, partial [Candidatus Marinimicrobia bacterium]|nr:hypothetical protein [Candidatus Neomarinimicrobiota bacterium]